ncbi:MAG: GDP-mannose 4,6-dehydratase [Elusimicrobia bacterium]|nr:GDP-mannose 4,6-dehydratase [Elusimicrobiota bacterium]
MKKEFWRGKRVLVTGHEGFLGSNLTRQLLERGAKIVGLDIKVDRKETIFTQEEYKQFITIKGSVADFSLVKKIMAQYKIEIIFHVAAEAIVGRSLEYPVNTFQANIEGTWNILEAGRQLGTVAAIIVASSDKAYGSHKILPYKEDTPLLGNHPYDVSKSCADLIAYTYHYTYDVPVAVTRCGNIYGPGDFNYSRIIPEAMRCMYYGRTLLIRSDGKFTRDYVYVDDIVNGYILLAEKLKNLKLAGEAFNISDENPLSVLKLLGQLSKLSGKKLNYKILDQAQYEIKDQYLASGKARKILGWKPKYTLEQGLVNTIDWYNRYYNDK